MKKVRVIGLVEKVRIAGTEKSKAVKAKIDTGASRSSISANLLQELGKPRTLRYVTVKNPFGSERRPLVRLTLKIGRKKVNSTFTVSKRDKMSHSVLLGVNSLRKLKVLVDPVRETK